MGTARWDRGLSGNGSVGSGPECGCGAAAGAAGAGGAAEAGAPCDRHCSEGGGGSRAFLALPFLQPPIPDDSAQRVALRLRRVATRRIVLRRAAALQQELFDPKTGQRLFSPFINAASAATAAHAPTAGGEPVEDRLWRKQQVLRAGPQHWGGAHPCPHLRRDWALPMRTSALGLSSLQPHLHRTPAHICTGTGPTPAHICTGTGRSPCAVTLRPSPQ